MSVFAQWQPKYADHNIPTVPVKFVCGDDGKIQKVPIVGRYGRFGIPASTKIAAKFPDAAGIGFVCGRRSRITVLDVDTADERVLTDALDRHGKTPIIARTASGKFHAYYRHNGERRWTKPRRDVPIDILGDGLSVAPPSQIGTGGRYEFIQGSLDDLDSLPVLHNLAQGLSAEAIATDFAGMREGDGRNGALFRFLARNASHCDDLDQLLDYARTQNEQFGEPMQDVEVVKVAKSVWRMHSEGRNRFGQHGAWVPLNLSRTLAHSPDAYALYGVLRAENGPTSVFPIANGMAETAIGLRRYRLANARKVILGLGLVEQVSPQTQHKPALYRWPRVQGADS